MKKICVFVLMFSLMCAFAYASETADVDVTVKVNTKFEMKVDRNNIDFDRMDPGSVNEGMPEEGIRVSAKSNSGRPWYVTVHALRELSNGSDYISNKNFFWYGWRSRSAMGSFKGLDKQLFTAEPAVVYIPDVTEYNNMRLVNGRLEGTDMFVKLGLEVPYDQNSGDYHTVVRFTMTE